MSKVILILVVFACISSNTIAGWKVDLERATKADGEGKSDEAERIFKTLLEKHADESEVWVAYGEHSRFYMHDYNRAEQAFQRALKSQHIQDGVSAFAYRGLGELAVKKADFEAAKKFFHESLLKQPLVDTHRSLCHLYCREKNYPAASRHAHAAVELVPDDAIAVLLHAILLCRNGAIKESQAAYLKAVQLSGLDSRDVETSKTIHCCVIYNAAGYLSVAGQRDDALKMLVRFLETPNHRHLTWAEIDEDADFDNIRSNPSFKELQSRYFKD